MPRWKRPKRMESRIVERRWRSCRRGLLRRWLTRWISALNITLRDTSMRRSWDAWFLISCLGYWRPGGRYRVIISLVVGWLLSGTAPKFTEINVRTDPLTDVSFQVSLFRNSAMDLYPVRPPCECPRSARWVSVSPSSYYFHVFDRLLCILSKATRDFYAWPFISSIPTRCRFGTTARRHEDVVPVPVPDEWLWLLGQLTKKTGWMK